MDSTPCPRFKEAFRRFRAFLVDSGWPKQIEWVKKTGDHQVSLSRAEARRQFESARHRGLGVCLHAIGRIGTSTYAIVEFPADSDEAERYMFPSDGGLKLSLTLKSDDVSPGSSQVSVGERDT